ncbi:hypothetical protein Syn8016DRAFT_0026 [Synechococcus sp. WH 8016]|nr:hypothetical protein Syn8016DRAFT_0026 [Synechococcus sp. WH 8016]
MVTSSSISVMLPLERQAMLEGEPEGASEFAHES